MAIKSIEQLDIEDKLLFIRTDYDYGLDEQPALAHFKIDYSVPTINYAIENGGKVIIASHRDVEVNKYNPDYSLSAVGNILSEKLSTNIYFPEDCIGDAVKKIKQDMKSGDVMLLENLMFYKQEAKNDASFSRKLSENIDIYVNEAFGLSQNGYSSLVGIPEHVKEKCAGLSFLNELGMLGEIKTTSEKPYLVYFCGGDVYSKIELLEHLTEKIDVLMLGGIFGNTLLKSIGYNLSEDQYDKQSVYKINKLYKSLLARGKKVLVAEDFMIRIKTEQSDALYIDSPARLKEDFEILAFGTETEKSFIRHIDQAGFILWDGQDCNYNGINSNPDTISELLKSSTEKVNIITVLLPSGKIEPNNENLQISYNIDCAYSYIKGETLQGVYVLESSNE